MRMPRRLVMFNIAMISTVSLGQETAIDINVQRANVVLVRAAYADGNRETAAALYVGKDQNRAYFVTALHVLRRRGGSRASSVKVQVFQSGAEIDAETYSLIDPKEDLAVISIRAADMIGTAKPMLQKNAAAGMGIRMIGHPAGSTWRLWSGTIEDEKADDLDTERFTTSAGPTLLGGYSGGPVLDADGNVIGMHLAVSDRGSSNLKIRYIRDFLVAANIPVSNLLTGISDPQRAAQAAFDTRPPDPSEFNSPKLVGSWEIASGDSGAVEMTLLELHADGTYKKTLSGNVMNRTGSNSYGGTHTGTWKSRGSIVYLSGDTKWPPYLQDLAKARKLN